MKYHAENIHQINFGGIQTAKESESHPPEEKKMKPNENPIMTKFFTVKKPPLEELVSFEATKGVSFRYIASSPLIQKGIRAYGYEPPKHHNKVRRLVHKSAENPQNIQR